MPIELIISRAAELAPHAAMASSAQLCVDDAKRLLESGDVESARRRALKSLAYSVGIGSPLYIVAAWR
jgi:uncharacterized protein (UPF0332 family)